ncbi:MAG: lipopolysaccharide biosynthesis protein, partial [Candidatus Helarchaeota archaeon]
SLEANLLNIVLTSLFLHKYFVIYNSIYVFIRTIILFLLLKLGFGLNGLLLGEVICYGLLMIMFFFLYKRWAQFNKGNNNDEVFPLKRVARYGGFSFFNEVGAQILSVSTDFFIISIFLGPLAVGIYAFANRIMQMLSIWMPHNLLREVIRPAFFIRYTQEKSVKTLERMFNLLTKFSAFFLFPLMVGIFILGDKLIIYIFDPKYISSLKVLWIVALFNAINCFMFPVGLILQSIEKVQINLFSKIFALYNIIGDLLVINNSGVIGIALVTATAVLFKNLFCLLFAHKYTGLAVDFKNIGVIGLNSLLMGILLYPFRKIIVNIISFILVIVIGAIIYLIFAYFNKAFSENERKLLNKILPKAVFVF